MIFCAKVLTGKTVFDIIDFIKQRRFAKRQSAFVCVWDSISGNCPGCENPGKSGGTNMQEMDLYRHTDTVNKLLARYGVKFGIYKNGTFREQLFPFDAIPRVISREEFGYLERGLKQRVMALNLFINDIYSDKKIIRDKVIPEEFVYASSGYLVQCEGVKPPKGIYPHIAGIDLVQGKDGN